MMAGGLTLGVGGFATCAGTRGCQRRRGAAYEAETASWLAAIRARGGNGMWLVSRGYHLGDDIIAIATNSPLSHASVLDHDGEQVIEAVGKGVVQSPLGPFLRESHRVLLVRPGGWTPEAGAKAVSRARGAVGKGYDFLGIVGVPSSNHFYCSELALWSMEVPVDRFGPQRVLHPRDLDHHGDILFDSRERDGDPDA
jgi:Permuted papain-like amidase enzyme, YaeF/YiiX, C92 family